MTPDPAGAEGLADALYQNGPLGFLAAFAVFAFLCMREFRRYREIDVQTYKAQIAELKEDIANLTREVEELRDSAFEGGVKASKQRTALATENARYRLLLARHGIDPDHPAFDVPVSADPPPDH
jgi:cell division protein FtsB